MASKIGYFNAVLTQEGKPIQATIYVYLAGTTTLATIYADPDGTTQKDNPFLTDQYGRFQFFADVGQYDIKITGEGIQSFTINNVGLTNVSQFTQLADTPDSYAGQAGKVIKVKNTEDGLEFGNAAEKFTDLSDTPSDYTGQAGKIVKVKSTEDGVEFAAGAGSGIDADTVDGKHASDFATATHNHDDRYVLLTDYEDADVLAKIKNVDGPGSGLNADLIDGLHLSSLLRTTGGNLKILVGSVSAAYSGTNVTFSSAFSTTPKVIVSAVGAAATPYVTNISTTGFKVYPEGVGAPGSCPNSGCRGWDTGNKTVHWIAIGGA